MQVDFYVMENADQQQALHELCRLLEAPYAAKQPIYIYTGTDNDAKQLDDLLWTYRDNSFLAHQITNDASNAPIEIGIDAPNAEATGMLVNLINTLPTFLTQFSHLIEIVYADTTVQQAARERFRQYRGQGFNIHTHKMKVNAT